jgi:hypothetical protein
MDVHSVYELFLRRFRRRRMRAFERCFRPGERTTILDVGGTAFNWQLVEARSRITLLNLELPEGFDELPPNYGLVVGSALDLEFEDGAFDVGFSNSVIEHLGTREKQEAFAREIRRVSAGWAGGCGCRRRRAAFPWSRTCSPPSSTTCRGPGSAG